MGLSGRAAGQCPDLKSGVGCHSGHQCGCERYRLTLPPSKKYIVLCQKEALLLHPGVIEKEQMQNGQGDFWVEYQIQEHDGEGSEWLVLCDLKTGKVIRQQKLIGNTP